MAHLYVIAGHGAGDPGACAYGFQEAERVRALASHMANYSGVTVLDTSVDWYQTGGISTLDIPKGDQLLELHLDSAGPDAHGGHVIIKEGFDPDDYDNALANYLGSKFPGRASLIVPRSDLANVNRAAARGISYRLAEICFISNEGDINKFNNEIANIACDIVSIFTGSPQPVPPTPPTPPSPHTGGTYVCVADAVRIRTAPSLSAEIVDEYRRGQTVVLDDNFTEADGCVWGTYIGASSHQRRYIAISQNGETYFEKC